MEQKKSPTLSKSYKLFQFYYRIGIFFNCVPFKYNVAKRRFRYEPGLKVVLWYVFTVGGILCETLLVTKVLIETKLDPNFPASEWSLIMFVFSSWATVSALYMNIHLRRQEFPSYLNQLVQIREYFTEEALPPSGDYGVIRNCLYSLTLNCAVQSLMVALEGSKPTYLYSLLPLEYRNSYTHLAWGIYAYWRVITNCSVGVFITFTGFMHVQTFDQIFRYRSLELRSLSESLKIYRMLQIFANRFNRNFSTMGIPYVTVFACANIILGNYGTLRFYDKLEPAAYLNLPLMGGLMMAFCMTYYPRMAQVKEASQLEYKTMLNESVKLHPIVANLMKAQRDRQHEELYAFHHKNSILQHIAVKLHLREKNEHNSESNQIIDSGQTIQENILTYNKYKEILCTVRACPPIGVNMGSFYQIKQSTVLTLFNFIACNTISALLTW